MTIGIAPGSAKGINLDDLVEKIKKTAKGDKKPPKKVSAQVVVMS